MTLFNWWLKARLYAAGNGQDTEFVIAVMGPTGSGKSTFIRTCLGRDVTVGNSLRSCTTDVTPVSVQYGRHRVTLIDTPGFDDTTVSDTDVLDKIAKWLDKMCRAGTKLSGIIYLHKISDNRVAGSSLKHFNVFRKLCGDDCLANILLVTTMWSEVDFMTGRTREKELCDDFWNVMISKGSQVVQHDNTPRSAHAIVRRIILKRRVVLKIQHELSVGRRLEDTEAGTAADEKISGIKRKQNANVASAGRNFNSMIIRKDQELKNGVERVRARLGTLVEQAERNNRSLRDDQQQNIRGLEWEIEELQRPVGKRSWGEIGNKIIDKI